MNKVLAVIPARGGSKGVLRKNLRLLGGKPLISYPIDGAKKCQSVSELVVSTDSDEISKFVKSLGTKVIMRPAEFATDHSPVIDSVLHALDELEKLGEYFDVVVLLQPTSPFWTSNELDKMLELFENSELDGAVSVIPSLEMHPSRMYQIDSDNFLSSLMKDGETIRRQDLSPVYFRNGCFYAVKTAVIRSQRTLMPVNKKAFLMDRS